METKRNISLRPYNTFHLDVKSAYLAEVFSPADLAELLKDPEFTGKQKLILGGGSNILFTKDYEGLVIRNNIFGIKKIREDEEYVWLTAGSGEKWHDLVMYCVSQDLGGIENLSLIPGTVGAAPMQNIGAYGVELKEVFEELTAMHLASGKTETFSKTACAFGYRESVFKHELKNQYMILSVTLKLKKNPLFNTSYGAIETELKHMGVTTLSIRAISEAVCNIRRSKLPDPDKIGNAGSFFKNPEIPQEQYDALKIKFPSIVGYQVGNSHVKLAAGWLIEHCGWKGKVSGNTGMHEKQALVLVNYGNATGQELLQHALTVQESVLKETGVKLEMEVNLV